MEVIPKGRVPEKMEESSMCRSSHMSLTGANADKRVTFDTFRAKRAGLFYSKLNGTRVAVNYLLISAKACAGCCCWPSIKN